MEMLGLTHTYTFKIQPHINTPTHRKESYLWLSWRQANKAASYHLLHSDRQTDDKQIKKQNKQTKKPSNNRTAGLKLYQFYTITTPLYIKTLKGNATVPASANHQCLAYCHSVQASFFIFVVLFV